MNYSTDILAAASKMFVATVILLILFWVILKFLKSRQGMLFTRVRGEQIEILDSRYIGVRKQISLVRVPGSVLVLGITNDSIRVLDKIVEKEILESLESQAEENTPSFSGHLKKLTDRFSRGKE